MPATQAHRTVKALLCLAVATAVIGGCAQYSDYEAFITDARPLVTATEYRMAPPDVVQVSSKRVREVDDHKEQIRPDGKITLPLIGSVFVAGKTTEQVSAELQALASEYYEDADVTLRVIAYNSKKIFVFGEVGTAGPYPYNGANTVLGTLAKAQPTRLADPTSIHILRPNADGDLVKRMTVNLDAMVQRGDTALDAVLEEGDIIYVPANPLASIGLALQQLLLPIQPAASVLQGPASIDQTLRGRPYQNPGNGGGVQ